MANENNLVRPPILGSNIAAAQAQQQPLQPSPELNNMIRNIVTQIMNTEGEAIIRNLTRNNNTEDISADESCQGSINDMDKVPDIVRSLREFSGNQVEFSSWKKSVERVLKIYEPVRGTTKYFAILSVIRNKITGNADSALESYNTPLNWKAISKCLTTYYADKRDLGTLEYQMTCLVQGRDTIEEFFEIVYSHLSLILNKIACMEISDESMQLLTKTYRDKALDTFVRGLNGDMSRLLGMREPEDLPQALYLCQKLENQNYRSSHANFRNRTQIQKPTRFQNNYQKSNIPQYKIFYPELVHLPQTKQNNPQYNQQYNQHNPQYHNQQYNPQHNQYYTQQNRNNITPPRPLAPKPLPKPEPMDIDQSLRTNNINYANRPNNNYTTKRPFNNSKFSHPPNKFQRNFHINTTTESQEPQNTHDCQSIDEDPEDDYEKEENFSDIHFLE